MTAVTQALTKSLSDVRRGLTERCVRVMAMYRKHVAVPTSMGQVSIAGILVAVQNCQNSWWSSTAGLARIVQTHAYVHPCHD